MDVLFLEDSERKARMIHRSLSHLNIEIRRVTTFKEFQRALVSEQFDLFISDINVPMFPGDSPEPLGNYVIREFRRKRGNSEEPVVFVSGDPDKKLEVFGNTFVYATPDVKDWVAKIEELLNSC